MSHETQAPMEVATAATASLDGDLEDIHGHSYEHSFFKSFMILRRWRKPDQSGCYKYLSVRNWINRRALQVSAACRGNAALHKNMKRGVILPIDAITTLDAINVVPPSSITVHTAMGGATTTFDDGRVVGEYPYQMSSY